MKTAWLQNRDGFDKAELVEEGQNRKIKLAEGPQKGQEMFLPSDGIPWKGFYPPLLVQDEKPEGFSFKRRFLQKVDISKYKNPDQAKALIPAIEPYDFQPHTAHLVDGILNKDHVLLFGHKGVGKTSNVLQIAARIGQPVIRVNVTKHTTIADFVGAIGINKEGTIFKDGPVITAMRQGYWLLLDEFDFGDAGVMALFHSILEREPQYTLKENDGEVVVADPRFRAFATGNSVGGDQEGAYSGTEKINAALLDRFSGHGQIINVKAMSMKQEKKVLQARLPNMPYRLVKRACHFAGNVRSDNLIPTFSTRELLNWCCKMMLTKDAVEAARITFLSVIGDEQKKKEIEQSIRDIIGRRIIVGRTQLPESVSSRPSVLTLGSPIVIAVGKPKANKIAAKPVVAGAKFGRTSSEVTDIKEMEKIWKLHKENGGTLSYESIELDKANNLRHSKGNTAWRICQNYAETTRRKKA